MKQAVASSSPPVRPLASPLASAPDLQPFQPLLMVLRQQAQLGNRVPRCVFIQSQLSQFGAEREIYNRGGEGAKTWAEYLDRAEMRGLVETGGSRGEQWVSLK